MATVTGADGTPDAEVLEVLHGRDVVLWPDADAKGRAHMEPVGQRLQGIARSLRWFSWEDTPEKGDAADYLQARPDAGALRAALAAAPLIFLIFLV
ncbi:MAG: hypothetical protein HY689_16310 [Chloroflexi bacterium]|nr:hypothetical protein [Chloroflexota bacterium]